ncbi:hypothetical protein IJH24_01550 [Candidatus Saccharibacteria bacterium]|nr:hypothetical protein [Candidatus Saccharibacteria bacterium]
MYSDPLSSENGFEKFPGGGLGEVSAEQAARAEQWDGAMGNGVPEFNGNQYGTANESNEYYGETTGDNAETEEELIEGADSATKLIPIINGIALEKGVEYTVDMISKCDVADSENPIADIYRYFGIEAPEKFKDLQYDSKALSSLEKDFNDGPNAPAKIDRSAEGIRQAVKDMKEIISEVRTAPRYAALREGARGKGVGIFEYAVSSFGVQDLTTLFTVLASQREDFGNNNEDAQEEEKESEEKNPNNDEEADEGVEEEIEDSEKVEKLEDIDKKTEEIILGTEGLNPEILKKDET